MGGQRHTAVALPPGKRPGTQCTWSWVGPRAGLEGCGKSRRHRGLVPGLFSPYRVTIPATISRPIYCEIQETKPSFTGSLDSAHIIGNFLQLFFLPVFEKIKDYHIRNRFKDVNFIGYVTWPSELERTKITNARRLAVVTEIHDDKMTCKWHCHFIRSFWITATATFHKTRKYLINIRQMVLDMS